MEKNNIKKRLSSQKGITLVALLLTVFIMIIIEAIALDNGLDSVDDTRLDGFYTQLEIIQKRVDDIVSTNEGYYVTSEEGTQTYLDIQERGGTPITDEQATLLQGILDKEGINIPTNEFKYFTIANLKEQLDLLEIDYDVFIHFKSRTIVSEKGISAKGETYYALKNNVYYVEQDTSKNEGNLELNYTIKKYGVNNYKVTIIPNTIGDLNANGILRYKKTTTKYWETANSLDIIVSELTKYNIEYKDKNNNVIATILDLTNIEEDSKEHSYTSKILKIPTCTEEGKIEFRCSECENFYTEAIFAVGHNYKREITKLPTATEEGIVTYACVTCGHSYTEIISVVAE